MSREQDQKMRTVLARLELTSCGTIYSYAPLGKGGGRSQEPRSGDPSPPHLHYLRRYNEATTDHARARVILEAEDVLARVTRRTAPRLAGETTRQRDQRILKEGEGAEARVVANAFRVNLRDVWRVRREGLRDKDYGRVIVERDPTRREATLERQRRVRELRERFPGMTNRQIGLLVGAHHSTVQNDLREAA